MFQGLAFRQGFNQLFSASKDRTVKIWSLDEMAYVDTLYVVFYILLLSPRPKKQWRSHAMQILNHHYSFLLKFIVFRSINTKIFAEYG